MASLSRWISSSSCITLLVLVVVNSSAVKLTIDSPDLHSDMQEEELTMLPTQTCQPLTIQKCTSLGHHALVQFPNTLGHRNQSSATAAFYQELIKFRDNHGDASPVVRRSGHGGRTGRCEDAVTHVLCLLYAPRCRAVVPVSPPCRALCEAAREACSGARLIWPAVLECHRFPTGSTACRGDELQAKPVPEPMTKAPVHANSESVIQTSVRPTTLPTPVSRIKSKVARWQHRSLKSRRYDLLDSGNTRMFSGWADVQGQGAANDFCRVIGRSPKTWFLSCALAGGMGQQHVYVSDRGFDAGHSNTWFMRDMDGDGRDDYCRCVGRGIKAKISCMKSGGGGFYGSMAQPGSQYTFTLQSAPCVNKPTNPQLGPTVHHPPPPGLRATVPR